MNCALCNSVVASDARFCGGCGAPVARWCDVELDPDRFRASAHAVGEQLLAGNTEAVRRRVTQAIDGINRDNLQLVRDVLRSPAAREIARQAKHLDDQAGGIMQRGLRTLGHVLLGGKRS